MRFLLDASTMCLPREQIPEAIHKHLDSEPFARLRVKAAKIRKSTVFSNCLAHATASIFQQYKPSTIIRRMERRLRATRSGDAR